MVAGSSLMRLAPGTLRAHRARGAPCDAAGSRKAARCWPPPSCRSPRDRRRPTDGWHPSRGRGSTSIGGLPCSRRLASRCWQAAQSCLSAAWAANDPGGGRLRSKDRPTSGPPGTRYPVSATGSQATRILRPGTCRREAGDRGDVETSAVAHGVSMRRGSLREERQSCPPSSGGSVELRHRGPRYIPGRMFEHAGRGWDRDDLRDDLTGPRHLLRRTRRGLRYTEHPNGSRVISPLAA